VLTARPKVAELLFRLYGRPLHPELFVVHASRVVERGQYEAAQHPLPERRRLLSYRLKGRRNDRVECRGGVSYFVDFQLEPVEPELFWIFQEELAFDGERQGMLHRFDSSGRIAMGALSYINLEARNRTLTVQAFHTFPDDYAIVKSQSVFRLPQ